MGLQDKFGIGLEEFLHHALILPPHQGAGGVDQHAAGADVAGLVSKDLELQRGQLAHGVRVLLPDVGLFADDAVAGAGHIHQGKIDFSLQLGVEDGGVEVPRVHIAKAQTLRALDHQGHLVLVDIGGDDPSPSTQRHRRGEALAAGGGAAVGDQAIALGDPGAVHRQTGGGILDIELAVQEAGELFDAAGVFQHQAVFHPAMGLGLHALPLQPKQQLRGGGLQRIDLDHGVGGGVVGLQHSFQPVLANVALKECDQSGGMGIFRRQIRRSRQGIPAPDRIAQNAVDQCCGVLLLFAVALRQVHGLIDRGGIGDLVQKQELVQPQMEDVPEHGPQVLEPSGQQLLKVVVQQRPVLQHAVGKPCGQGRVPAVQPVPGELLFQQSVGPAALGPAVFQHIQCAFSGGHIRSRWGGPGNSREPPCACRPRPGAGGSR